MQRPAAALVVPAVAAAVPLVVARVKASVGLRVRVAPPEAERRQQEQVVVLLQAVEATVEVGLL